MRWRHRELRGERWYVRLRMLLGPLLGREAKVEAAEKAPESIVVAVSKRLRDPATLASRQWRIIMQRSKGGVEVGDDPGEGPRAVHNAPDTITRLWHRGGEGCCGRCGKGATELNS